MNVNSCPIKDGSFYSRIPERVNLIGKLYLKLELFFYKLCLVPSAEQKLWEDTYEYVYREPIFEFVSKWGDWKHELKYLRALCTSSVQFILEKWFSPKLSSGEDLQEVHEGFEEDSSSFVNIYEDGAIHPRIIIKRFVPFIPGRILVISFLYRIF